MRRSGEVMARVSWSRCLWGGQGAAGWGLSPPEAWRCGEEEGRSGVCLEGVSGPQPSSSVTSLATPLPPRTPTADPEHSQAATHETLGQKEPLLPSPPPAVLSVMDS